MTWRRRFVTIVGFVLTVSVLPTMAAAVQVVVIDHDGPTSGNVVLRPSVVNLASDTPPRFVLANEGAHAVVATLTLTDPARRAARPNPFAEVRLAPSEAALVDLEAADIGGVIARLEVRIGGSDDQLVGWFVRGDRGDPVAVDQDAGTVVLSSSEPTVVTVQLRRRSWLGTTSSHLVVGPLPLVDTRVMEPGRGPWLPGPSWTDVHVTDHAGTTTSVTFQDGSVARDAAIAAVLLVAAAMLLGRQVVRGRSAHEASSH
ncbi:MAG: hypothetical protein R3249_06790 [Nitriliruptorales bacterium]|nr:hypothetical protein [Nitriliruptorales bacterium]